MKVEELTNYGKGVVDTVSDPELMKRGRKVMMREFRRELGLIGLLKMGWRMRKEARRMKNMTGRGSESVGLPTRDFWTGSSKAWRG